MTLSRGRLWCVLAVSWQRHLAGRRARIGLGGHWSGKCECAIARVIAWIWRNELVVMLMVVLGLQRCAFLLGTRSCLKSARGCRGCRIVTKTREADWTRLHVLSSDI